MLLLLVTLSFRQRTRLWLRGADSRGLSRSRTKTSLVLMWPLAHVVAIIQGVNNVLPGSLRPIFSWQVVHMTETSRICLCLRTPWDRSSLGRQLMDVLITDYSVDDILKSKMQEAVKTRPPVVLAHIIICPTNVQNKRALVFQSHKTKTSTKPENVKANHVKPSHVYFLLNWWLKWFPINSLLTNWSVTVLYCSPNWISVFLVE